MKIVANLTVISVWVLCLIAGIVGMYQLGEMGVLSARISCGYSLAWLAAWSTIPHCVLTGIYGLAGNFGKISKQF